MKNPDISTEKEFLMLTTRLRSGFFSRCRIEILMWALIAEMLASPLADTHPRAGASLGVVVLLIVLFGIRFMAICVCCESERPAIRRKFL